MERRHNWDVIVSTLAPQGKRVVDVGCGDGALTRRLAREGAQVIGVECSAAQLAKARAAKAVDGAQVVEGVGQALPVADASADWVVFFNSFHHIPGEVMERALAEAARVLVPGGMVYVSEPVAEGEFFTLCRAVDDETAVRARALAAVRAARGFEAVDELHYLHTVSLADFAAFHDRIVSANTEREAIFATQQDRLRPLFDALGRANADGGRDFDQPMRVNLLRKVG